MAKTRAVISAFNRGMISPLGLARAAEEDRVAGRVRLSAETQTNWIPRVLGSMMLRPGLGYTGATYNNNKAVFIPFTFATDDLADIEFTDSAMRVWVDDTVISRASVSTAITNGTFDSNVTGWTDADETGATSAWGTGGYLSLLGTSFSAAIRRQQVSVGVSDRNISHALRVIIARGVVTIKVGSSAGASDYFERTLKEGEYSLAFTPTADFHIELSATTKYASLVDSIAVESSGDMVIASPYAEADLGLIRWEQSADVVFMACDGYRQYKIERFGSTSWALVKYYADDGPFRAPNLSKTTLTPSAVSGDITLAASAPVFKSTNVGSLYSIGSIGQYVELDATGAGQWSSAISVSGVGTTRDISVVRAGTWSATVTLQRSSDGGTTWAEVATYTTNATVTYNDALDNQDLQYRIGIDTGDYTSGTAELSLTYSTGSLTGFVRITGFNSETSVNAIVLKELGGASASSDWAEGEWSDRRGFPTCITLYESRLCFFGRGKSQISESDAYYDFDSATEGNAGPINRSVGAGPVDVGNWMFSGSRLVIGTDGGEIVTRQSFDELMAPANFGFKNSSRIGSAKVPCAAIDGMPIFVQRSGKKIYHLAYDSASYDYVNSDMMELVPEIGEPSITRIAVQRQPDTRIHALRSDGKVAVMVSDFAEEVSCWLLYETDGIVEDIYVQPGSNEDTVYYIVKRTIGGSTKRYREKFALESECQGGTLNKQADSFITYTGAASATITGLSHLEGEEVIVWANGADLSPDDENGDQTTYTVSGGQITLGSAQTNVVVGLPYDASYKSVKLVYGAEGGTALTQVKRIDHIAPIFYNTHHKGLKYGRDFDNLYDLPQVKDGAPVAADTIHAAYDQIAFEFDGEYNTDSRLCLRARAPRPCTLLGVVISLQTNEKG